VDRDVEAGKISGKAELEGTNGSPVTYKVEGTVKDGRLHRHDVGPLRRQEGLRLDRPHAGAGGQQSHGLIGERLAKAPSSSSAPASDRKQDHNGARLRPRAVFLRARRSYAAHARVRRDPIRCCCPTSYRSNDSIRIECAPTGVRRGLRA